MKQRILSVTPERIHPMLKGLYYSVYPEKKNIGRNENPYKIVENAIDFDSPIVIDGGAYDGRTTMEFQNLFSDATIHAFEPVPSHIEMFKKCGVKKCKTSREGIRQ